MRERRRFEQYERGISLREKVDGISEDSFVCLNFFVLGEHSGKEEEEEALHVKELQHLH